MIKIVTKQSRFLLYKLVFLLIFSLQFSISVHAATICTISIKEKDGVSTVNYPLTFGHVFAQGEVFGKVYLNNYPTQTDVKTTWPDGSIRHAVISSLVQMVANQTTVLSINDTGIEADSAPISKAAILATGIGAKINLTNISGSSYSGSLTADLRTAINSESALTYWLGGGVVSEIIVDQKLNNSLNATWEVRFYPGTPYTRVSHAVENVEANYRGDVDYAVTISHDNTSPSIVYSKSTFQHNAMARWRKVLWLDTEPPEIEIHYDLDYLISTGHIPSYDSSLIVSESAIASQYSAWNSVDTDIMGDGLQDNGFASGHEGALLQPYAVRYLLTFDNRLREVVLGMGEVTASCPVHYREYDSNLSFYKHVLSINDRPSVRLRESKTTNLPAPIDTMSSQWSVDLAHQWSYNYLPYLITGEKWFLDELYFWAGFNLAIYNPDYRNFDEGRLTFNEQLRGAAWAYRTMVQAASIAPDNDIEKDYFEDKIANNISYYKDLSKVYTLRYMESRTGIQSGHVSSVTAATSAWMEDFFAVALVHGGDLGYDASSVLNEHSKFIVGRFTHPDFNWHNGVSYRFPTYTTAEVTTWAQASSLYSAQPTSLPVADYAQSYRFKAMAACSQLTHYPNGQAAYDWLKANVNSQDALNDDPTWALVPRSPTLPVDVEPLNPPENLRISK